MTRERVDITNTMRIIHIAVFIILISIIVKINAILVWHITLISIQNRKENIMTIGLIAKLQIVPNKNQDFETAFKQLAEIVNTTEEGCLLYVLHKSRDDAQTYVVLEQYADENALKAHSKTDHYQAFGKKASAFLAAAPHIELLDSV